MTHICLECMNDKGELTVCPFCGWDETQEQEPSIYLKRGTVLNGKYIVGKVLGHGGFGITYLAWDKVLQVKLAIKEYFQSELATRGPDNTLTVFTGFKAEQFVYGKEKFLDEVRTIAKFHDHEGIVSVRDYFEENKTAYFVMQYLEGITFKEYLDRNGGKITWDMALKIMMPVLDALRAVHQVGVLHRDVSPDNIYITESGQVKILDFGAARYAMGEHSKSLSVILKPGYAPEEQYRSNGKQGAWTDVYAASACFYRSMTGTSPQEALDRLYEDTLKPLSGFNLNIPNHVSSGVMKGLAVRAGDRFQTVRDFQDVLLKNCESDKGPVRVEENIKIDNEPKNDVKPIINEKPMPEASQKMKQSNISTQDDKNKKDNNSNIENVVVQQAHKKEMSGIIFGIIIIIVILGSLIVIIFLTRGAIWGGRKLITSTDSMSMDPEITNSLGMTFVYIQPGEFTMGSDNGDNDERPAHTVRLTRGFYMQTTEVTVDQYMQFVEEIGKHHPEWKEPGSEYHIETGDNDHYSSMGSALQGKNYPIVGVSWWNATAYAQWLSRKETERTGQAVEYRLPTEAEWEYACRAGSDSDYANEKALAELGWYDQNAGETTHKVGKLSPNAWGLYDMHGNVGEWCYDGFRDYGTGIEINPSGGDYGPYRVIRGGNWDDIAEGCRSAYRSGDDQHTRSGFCGFRLALSLGQ